jgi:LPS-assembly protein
MIRDPLLTFVALGLLAALPANAQDLAGCVAENQWSWTADRIGDNHWRRTGAIEIECDDMRFYADDQLDIYTDTGQVVASGNVVFTSPGSRIAAERAEFNTRTKTGTFFNATGTATLKEEVDRSMFGGQEPDAFFYGETVEKIGPKKYRITHGGFTTCVQPTPRWEVVSTSATVTLDEYAILTNSLLKVKGVPLFYLPWFYYPIQEDDRATGFLLPTYGASTIQGQTLRNAFFWAIGRSQDATIYHDWYSQTGQSYGGEYRYVAGIGSEGSLVTNFLDEHEATIGSTVQPARRSYQLQGNMTQALPGRLRARANVDYFSDITVQQLYHQDVTRATNRRRIIGGNITGNWGAHTLSGTYDRNETFIGDTQSATRGGTPRLIYTRAQRPIGASPVYVSLGTEFVNLLGENRAGTTEVDTTLNRLDITPTARIPFTRWPFLTINSSATWRNTFWSESPKAWTSADGRFPWASRGSISISCRASQDPC